MKRNDSFYDVSYRIMEKDENVGDDHMLIRATTEQSQADLVAFIKNRLGKKEWTIIPLKIETLDIDTYVARGGEEKAPWFNLGRD